MRSPMQEKHDVRAAHGAEQGERTSLLDRAQASRMMSARTAGMMSGGSEGPYGKEDRDCFFLSGVRA